VVKMGRVRVLLVSASVPARVASVPVVGSVTLVSPVVVKIKSLAGVTVKEPATFKTFPSAIVSVEAVAGAVMVTLLMEVAVAAPKTGAVSVLFVRVSEPVKLARVLTPAGKVGVELAVVVRIRLCAGVIVRLALVLIVLPSAIVSVEAVAGAVTVTLLMVEVRMVAPLIAGEVRVLLVSVCVAVVPTNAAPATSGNDHVLPVVSALKSSTTCFVPPELLSVTASVVPPIIA